jgi:type III pantothenate kinase
MKAELLLVDLGNTRVKWAAVPARGPLRLSGDEATVDLNAAWVEALARKHPHLHLVLASVVPKWTAAFIRAFRGRSTVVSGLLRLLPPLFAYPRPSKLGADRIAAAVAAQGMGLFPAIIVACGTATAFTVLDAEGRLCGGAIAPGLHAQLAALIGATAQLPATSLQKPRRVLAQSTREAIRAGVLLGYQGGVKEIVLRLGEALPPGAKPHLILTGGHAKLVSQALAEAHTLRPLLVLEGLRMIGQRLGETAQ